MQVMRCVRFRAAASLKIVPAAHSLLTLLVIGLSTCGCTKTAKDYTPASDQARKAVEIALTAWSQGGKIGNLDVEGLKVEPEDFEWRSGKKLQKFEILDEVAGDPMTKRIQVKLTIAGGEPKTATYHVVGKGPLAVIRDKDFASMSRM